METVMHAFDDDSTARQVVERLARAGIAQQQVTLHKADAATAAGIARGGVGQGETPNRGVLDSIGRFFVSAIGGDHPRNEVDAYAEAARRGMCVVAVEAADAAQADAARKIMTDAASVQTG